MAIKFLIHPGFHKTGTSTLQRGALACRKTLDNRLQLLLTDDVRNAVVVARRYSVHPDQKRLDAFQTAFFDCVRNLDKHDERPVLLSSEALLGQLPGRKNVQTYSAGPALLQRMLFALRELYEDNVDPIVWFTTREKKAWLKSVYYQNLRMTRLTDEFSDYWLEYSSAADFDKIIDNTAAAVSGIGTVSSTAVETCSDHPLWSLGVALDMLNVDSSDLPALTAQNVQPADAAERLLELNRSRLSDEEVSAAKRDLLYSYRKSGQAHRPPRTVA